MTTGSDGTVTSDVLCQGVYTIDEIVAPAGYEIDPEESHFTLEVTSDGGAVRRVKNNKISTIDIPVAKVWDDADNQDGIRPLNVIVRLLANGTDTGATTGLNEANNWTASFTDLDEYQNGEKIAYTIEEVTVPGYTTAITGDTETGYTVTNTHEPEKININGAKTWDDNNDQDGARPDSITIRLLANGSEVDSKTVTETDDWSWSFTNLPKYENEGIEIVYTITENMGHLCE